MADRFDPQLVIDNYLAAYIGANSKRLGLTITYERGWFAFRSEVTGDVITRHRRHQVERMTRVLTKRERDLT